MRVLLVNPPNKYELVANDPVIVKDQQGVSPPLGILYIAAYLKKNTDHELFVLDCQAENLAYSEMAYIVRRINPDVIGMTVMTFTLIDTQLAVRAIRGVSKAYLILGGPHPTIYPEETLEAFRPDYVICGEGELAFAKLLNNIPSSQKIWRSESFIRNLDNLPFPARELTDINKYYSVLARDNPTTTMFSSRGCPFQCTYCDRPALGKQFRAMSAERTVDEMEHCANLGIREIFFYDDTFTVSKQRVIDICELLLKRNIKLSWDVRSRVNTVDEDMIRMMKRAGCVRIHFGVESAQPHILKALNKGITRQQVEDAFKWCRKHGVKSLAYFMLGNPGESTVDILETIRFAKRIRPDYMQCTILTPFPATKLYGDYLKTGKDVWREYALNPTINFRPPIIDSYHGRVRLNSLLKEFYHYFYFDPSFMLRSVLDIRNMKQIKRYFNAAMSLLRM